MQYNAVIDVSSIIWDREDYETNKHDYYNLLFSISSFLTKLLKEKPTILIRDELLLKMASTFPAREIPSEFWAIVGQVYSFLGKSESKFRSYPDNITAHLISIPSLLNTYFDISVKAEVNYLISKIHTDEEDENVYFTFEYLWGENGQLKTQLGPIVKEYQTVVADRKVVLDITKTELDVFFASLRPVFEHNRKHDKTGYNSREFWEKSDNKLGFVSQLSCYNGYDTIKPQEILNKRYPQKIDSRYIGYDEDNGVFVVFRNHGENKYHGYDEYNEDNHEKIPLKVRAHFNK